MYQFAWMYEGLLPLIIDITTGRGDVPGQGVSEYCFYAIFSLIPPDHRFVSLLKLHDPKKGVSPVMCL